MEGEERREREREEEGPVCAVCDKGADSLRTSPVLSVGRGAEGGCTVINRTLTTDLFLQNY